MEGGTTQVAGSISSQFLSGLLMAAPNARGPVQIDVEGELVSRSYVEMTWRVMERFGVQVERRSERSFLVPAPQRYRACRYEIEPDASAASYFFAVAAITDGDVLVEGVRRDGLQGDAGFVDVLQAMGCQVDQLPDGLRVRGTGRLRGVDIDMNTMSDTVQTLAMVALFAEGPTRVRGVAHNRHKETDRIGDLATELRKLGAEVIEHSDGMTIVPGVLRPATLETYNDHRMAMSFALAGLRVPGIQIVHPICIEKTYPNFFDDLSQLTGSRWSDANRL